MIGINKTRRHQGIIRATAACDDSLGPPPSNVFHGDQNDNEGSPHDELPPVEVGSPLVSQQVAQLLMNRIVPREGDSLRLDSLGGRNHILAVPKDVLDLHVRNQIVGHREVHAVHACAHDNRSDKNKQLNQAFMQLSSVPIRQITFFAIRQFMYCISIID